MEMGSVYSRLGSKVTVVEFQPQIGASMDGEVAKATQKFLKSKVWTQIKHQSYFCKEKRR